MPRVFYKLGHCASVFFASGPYSSLQRRRSSAIPRSLPPGSNHCFLVPNFRGIRLSCCRALPGQATCCPLSLLLLLCRWTVWGLGPPSVTLTGFVREEFPQIPESRLFRFEAHFIVHRIDVIDSNLRFIHAHGLYPGGFVHIVSGIPAPQHIGRAGMYLCLSPNVIEASPCVRDVIKIPRDAFERSPTRATRAQTRYEPSEGVYHPPRDVMFHTVPSGTFVPTGTRAACVQHSPVMKAKGSPPQCMWPAGAFWHQSSFFLHRCTSWGSRPRELFMRMRKGASGTVPIVPASISFRVQIEAAKAALP